MHSQYIKSVTKMLKLPCLYRASVTVVILLLYTLPGTIGHTPWKQDEAYSFGIIQHMLESGQWLVPVNAGQPFMEKPPLYYWTATAFATFFRQWLPLHDAARLASAFYFSVSCLFVAQFAEISFRAPGIGSWQVIITLALYAAAPGMIKHAHDMFTDVALLAGSAIALYGLQRVASSSNGTALDAFWLALGIVTAMLSKGVFIPAIFALTSCALPFVVRGCCTRRYWQQLCLAALIAIPLILIWPTLLFLHSPELFYQWFWQNNIGRFIGFSVPQLGAAASHFRIIEALAFFCFPAGVLALIYLLRGGWKHITHPEIAVPLLFTSFGLVVLQISSTSRHLYLLPFIAPMSVLATRGLLLLSDRFLRGWMQVMSYLFALLVLLVWGIYVAALSQQSMQWLSPLARWLPMNFIMPLHIIPLILALTATVVWCFRARWITIQGKVAAAQEWFLAILLLWGLVFTLLLPWLENARGYQAVYTRMQRAIAADWQAGDCVSSFNLGESEAPLLYYFTGILHRPIFALSPEQTEKCRWLLTESREKPVATPVGMSLIWQDARDGDNSEFLMLFKVISVK